MDHDQFAKKYDEILLDGLSSHKSYIVLHQNETTGIHLGLQPLAVRIDNQIIMIGGKLRSAWHFTDMDVVKPDKVIPSTLGAADKLLREAYPDINWIRGSNGKRVSTVVGLGITAGYHDVKEFKKLWEENDYIEQLLKLIASAAHVPLDGPSNVKEAEPIIHGALRDYYEEMIPELFGSVIKLSKLGDVIELMDEKNQTAKIISFKEKLEEKAKKEAEETTGETTTTA